MQVVEVTATGTYYGLYHLMGLIGVTIPPSAPISRTTEMRYNYQRPENNTRFACDRFQNYAGRFYASF
jgi:hypothetical protein